VNFTFTSPGYIVLASADPHTFNLAIFTAQNYDLWWAGKAEPAVYRGSVGYGDVIAAPIAEPGNYTAVLYPIPNLQYDPQIYITEYNGTALPIGVVSFPRSPIAAGAVRGYFHISAIRAYNPNGERRYGVPNSGAGLQLNAVVAVELADGRRQYYWAQDVVGLITDKDEVSVWDNIWNDSGGLGALSGYAIAGNGQVYSSSGGWYYGYTAFSGPYALPIGGYLVMRAYAAGGSVHVDFGYALGGGVVWYDRVTITPYVPAVDAHFEVGALLTGDGHPMDASLVFAGYGNYEWTNFTDLHAELALEYWNGSAWLPLPNDYDAGPATGEAAFADVNVTVPNGRFVLTAPGPFTPGLLVYLPQYPVRVVSPIAVNGVMATNYTAWVRPGSQIVIEARSYVFSNGTMLVPNATSETLRVISPSALSVSWSPRYLVSIRSALPVYVNGVPTRNYTAWATPGSSVRVEAHGYIYGNGTMFVPGVANVSLIVDAPTALAVSWSPRYLVSVVAAMPIYVNGTLARSYAAWAAPGPILSIQAPAYGELGGLVVYWPNATDLALTVGGPVSLEVAYSPDYARLAALATAAAAAAALLVLLKGRRPASRAPRRTERLERLHR
jgi:thermopsin